MELLATKLSLPALLLLAYVTFFSSGVVLNSSAEIVVFACLSLLLVRIETRLGRGALSDYELNFIMRGIALGLAELHRCEVIRRELSPKSILLRERDDRPILTDMELAKLTSGKPTVSPERWPDDPYRALEICGGSTCDARADVYSWARIFVHAANGSLPPRGEEQLHPREAIPNKVRELVLKAASITPSARPTNMTAVLDVLRVWS